LDDARIQSILCPVVPDTSASNLVYADAGRLVVVSLTSAAGLQDNAYESGDVKWSGKLEHHLSSLQCSNDDLKKRLVNTPT